MNEEYFVNLATAYADAHKIDTMDLKILPTNDVVNTQTITTLEFTVDVPTVYSLDSRFMIKVWQAKGAGNFKGVCDIFVSLLGYSEKFIEFMNLSREDKIDVIDAWVGGHYTWKD